MRKNPFTASPGIFSPWTLLLVLALALLIFIPALNEYFASKKDLLQIWNEQGQLLSETILRSADRITVFDSQSEQDKRQRLLEMGSYVRQLDSLNYPNTRHIRQSMRRGRHMYPIFIGPDFRIRSGNKNPMLQKEAERIADWLRQHPLPVNVEILPPDVIGLPGTDALAIRRSQGHGFIVLIVPPPGGMRDRQEQRFLRGWMDHLTAESAIVYIALLRGGKLLYGSGPVPPGIEQADSTSGGKLRELEGRQLFEYRRPGPAGLQVVLSLPAQALERLEKELTRRLIINSLILLILGSVLIVFLLKKQNFSLLEQRYSHLQTYSTSVLENIDEGIIVVNADQTIAVLNPAARHLLQLDNRQWIGASLLSLEYRLATAFTAQIQNFSTFTEQPLTVAFNSSPKELLLSGHRANLKDAGQSQTVFITLIRDNSTQRELETFRNRKSKLMAMGELASRVAHEIRNPLNGIAVLAQRIQKEFEPRQGTPDFEQMTQTIRSESARINTIIESFLQYARSPELKPETVTAGAWLNELFPVLQAAGKLESAFDIPADIRVTLDSDQMKQALLNLVTNARQAAADTPVWLRGFCHDNQLVLQVDDRGPGLDADQREKIFELYYTTRTDGNGLGLSIVQKIVDLHNGRVRVESPYQFEGSTVTGSRFEIVLPVITTSKRGEKWQQNTPY